jgi:hypothetical protein
VSELSGPLDYVWIELVGGPGAGRYRVAYPAPYCISVATPTDPVIYYRFGSVGVVVTAQPDATVYYRPGDTRWPTPSDPDADVYPYVDAHVVRFLD